MLLVVICGSRALVASAVLTVSILVGVAASVRRYVFSFLRSSCYYCYDCSDYFHTDTVAVADDVVVAVVA